MKMHCKYTIEMADLALRYFRIHAHFSVNDESQSYRLNHFILPTWIPGSYMVRDFAKHIIAVAASSAGKSINIQKIAPHIWQTAPHIHTEIDLVYTVFANDNSIRGAYLGFDRAFWNHTSLCLQPSGFSSEDISIEIVKPKGLSGFVSTSLSKKSVDEQGFGLYFAKNYDELIDHPVEISDSVILDFDVYGTPHQVVLSGDLPKQLNLEQIKADLERICMTQAKLFDAHNTQALAFDRYVFLIHVRKQAYGGLEHRNSTALLCSPEMLPTEKSVDANLNQAYRQFLGLCSHEYFHTWHVKRIKPSAFIPYNLSQVADTSLLWVFEGFTAYFDDWILQKAGLINTACYLDILSKTWAAVVNHQGHQEQSLHDAGVDAWIKYYKPDENSANATVSYYTKGALLAACIDLLLRIETQGKTGLCDVLVAVWAQCDPTPSGEKTFVELGLERADIEAALLMHLPNQSAQQKMICLLTYVDNTHILPFVPLLLDVGLSLETNTQNTPGLGVRLNEQLTILDLYANSPAHRAGLTHGDQLLALENSCVQNKSELEKALNLLNVGEKIELSFRRNNQLHVAHIELIQQQIHANIKQLDAQQTAIPERAKLLQAWLQHS